MKIRTTSKMSAQVIAALFAVGTGIGSAQAASLVTNGSFEVRGATDAELVGWADVGSVKRESYGGASDGNWGAYFNTGGEAPTGVISQVLSVTSGVIYNLNFDLGVSFGDGITEQIRVKINEGADGSGTGLLNEVYEATGSDFPANAIIPWEAKHDQFLPFASEVLIQFIDETSIANAANLDLALDNVRVNPVPLPPAVWLLGSALFGLLSIAKRKQQS